MPGFNQTGPTGAGAMTGRQRGMCRKNEDQSLVGNGRGQERGMGMCRGLGQGSGLGRRAGTAVELSQSPATDGSDEVKILKDQYQAAQKSLSSIEKKLAALETGK